MRIAAAIIVTLCLPVLVGRVTAHEHPRVLVIQTVASAFHTRIIEGIRQEPGLQADLVSLEADGAVNITREVARLKPDIIVAIGSEALTRAARSTTLPIIYTMVLSRPPSLSDRKNITGVDVMPPANVQLSALLDTVPAIKRIGVIYDPAKSGPLVKKMKDAAERAQVTLVERRIESSKEVSGALLDLEGKIDGLWLVPDTTVVTADTTMFVFSFSLRARIPVLAFSERYVREGALLSVGYEGRDIGRKIGEIAREICQVRNRSSARYEPPTVTRYLNMHVARSLGLTIGAEAIRKAQVIQ